MGDMDSVVDFKVNLDISDRESLYDYGKEQFVLRPQSEAGWTSMIFQQDMTGVTVAKRHGDRMKRFDDTLHDKRFLQKDFTRERQKEGATNTAMFSGFDSEQELPMRVLPVYYPGDVVQGTVVLEVSDPMKVKQVTLRCIGSAYTEIWVRGDKGRKHKATGHEDYMDERRLIWKNGMLYDSYGGVRDSRPSSRLPVGKIDFPFSFILPGNAVPSLPALWHPKWKDADPKANINYRLVAVIEYGNCCARGDIVACKGFLVDRKMALGTTLTLQNAPVTQKRSVSAGVFGGSGNVILKATIPTNVFVKHDQIPVSVELENQSDQKIDELAAKVILSGKTNTGSGICDCVTATIEPRGQKVSMGMVKPGESRNHNITVPVNFYDSTVYTDFLPTGDLKEECSLIYVQYFLQVKARRKGMLKNNVRVRLPFFLGTHK